MVMVTLSLIFVTLAALAGYRIATEALNATTGLLFLLAVSSGAALIVEAALKARVRSNVVRNRVRLLIASTAIAMVTLEFVLRILGAASNYYEQNGNRNYVSIYQQQDTQSWFLVHSANSEVGWTQKEFRHARQTNSLGLSEREIQEAQQPAEYRVIALGDSFTEGVGTAYESTWVKVVEKELAAHLPGRQVTTINAGISGSDVYFEYVLLREKLLSYHPDLVIVGINHTDVVDIIIRGGMERFQSGGTITTQRSGPGWEWLYGISYIFRHIVRDAFGYNWLLLSGEVMRSEEQMAAAKIQDCMDDFMRLAADRHFKVLFVFNPLEYEVKAQQYDAAFQAVVADSQRAHGGSMIDLLEDFRATGTITRENSSEFFWGTDLHHNTKGYQVMGNAIARRIIELRLLDTQTY